MRIASSNIQLSSQHTLVEQEVTQEHLEMWIGERQPGGRQNEANPLVTQIRQDVAEISAQAKALYQEQLQGAVGTQGAEKAEDVLFELSEEDKNKLLLLQSMLEKLTGKKIKFVIPRAVKLEQADVSLTTVAAGRQQGNGPQRAGWGLIYNAYHARTESESTAFQAKGVVTTADGREINLAVDLKLSRQFMEQQSVNIRAGDALKDPLVINFSAPTAQLTDKKYSFDIDSDGTADQISFLQSGSGFLALDLNSDGQVNDGRELFGTQSGDGFSDLAKYDGDGNNWIDENDAIYNQLRIWSKDAQGNDHLLALGQQGVGAIYLGNVSTEFALKDAQNSQLGQLRQSGIFLKEDGGVGTVQKVDLAV